MPLTLLAALFLAFGLDAMPAGAVSLPRTLVYWRLAETLVSLLALAFAAWCASRVVSYRVRKAGEPTYRLRRGYVWLLRGFTVLNLGVYAAILHFLGWREVVRTGLGLEGWPLIEDVMILLPYVLSEAASTWGLFGAERVLRSTRIAADSQLRRHLVLKLRQTVGLLLPILIVFSLGQVFSQQLLPASADRVWAQPLGLASVGFLILAGSPLFLRLAWPTRSLPQGPLRTRLEQVARRVGFRCTDILVWDTGHSLVNAGVTGSLPWFRYVLLTDSLIDNLNAHEVAAVFGHEIGHIAHRHLLYFGLFFLGTIGVFYVVNGAIDHHLIPGLSRTFVSQSSTLLGIVKAGASLVVLALYVLIVFGYLSRRFERQADIFGCRAVSCGDVGCPPHPDLNDDRNGADEPAVAATLCPVGIRTFVNALTSVATLNGIGREARSWRHGSIQRRINFLESLEGRPEVERRFQSEVLRLRIVMALVLSCAWCAACATGWLSGLN